MVSSTPPRTVRVPLLYSHERYYATANTRPFSITADREEEPVFVSILLSRPLFFLKHQASLSQVTIRFSRMNLIFRLIILPSIILPSFFKLQANFRAGPRCLNISLPKVAKETGTAEMSFVQSVVARHEIQSVTVLSQPKVARAILSRVRKSSWHSWWFGTE